VHRMWYYMARIFAAQGHQVTIACRTWPQQARDEIEHGVRFIRKGGFDSSGRLVWDLFRDFFQAVKIAPGLPDADITIVNDFFLPFFIPKRCGEMLINANRYPKGQYRWYRRARKIIAASNYIADVIRTQAPKMASRISALPNAVSVDAFLGENKTTTRQFLFAGRIHPEKGLDTLLDACNQLKASSWSLTIMGPHLPEQGGGGNEYLESLKLKAKGLPVRFEPACYDVQQLGQIYRQHGSFIYPSEAQFGETFGVAPVEAMAAGMLVLCSDLNCFGGYLKADENALVFKCKDSQSLADKLNRILEQENWQNMRAEAIDTARSFSVEAVAGRWLKEMEALCS